MEVLNSILVAGSNTARTLRRGSLLEPRILRLRPTARDGRHSAWPILGLLLLVCALRSVAADKPVSYYNDIVPVLKRSCTGCHHPGKLKGQVDLTTYEAFKKGGKHGAGFIVGKPKESIVVDEISGDEPSMPAEGDPL